MLASSSLGVEQTYGSGYEPKSPVPFPAEFKDYQILPGTISPDQKFAFIYPKRSRLYELATYNLFLGGTQSFSNAFEDPTRPQQSEPERSLLLRSELVERFLCGSFCGGQQMGPGESLGSAAS